MAIFELLENLWEAITEFIIITTMPEISSNFS